MASSVCVCGCVALILIMALSTLRDGRLWIHIFTCRKVSSLFLGVPKPTTFTAVKSSFDAHTFLVHDYIYVYIVYMIQQYKSTSNNNVYLAVNHMPYSFLYISFFSNEQ